MMTLPSVEKRKYPRLDTSNDSEWRIRVFGLQGRPFEGRIVNLSLGGVAFVSHWKNVARTVKRFTTKVEIRTPDGTKVDANTTLLRIWPRSREDECICVLELTEMNKASTSRLKDYFTG